MLFHLAARDEWAAAVASGGPYDRSMPGIALGDVGFVHCSFAGQVEETRRRHYADRDDLVVLTIDEDRLGPPVRVEGGFPHVYGPIDLDAVVATSPAPPV